MFIDEFIPMPDLEGGKGWIPFRKIGPFVFISGQTGVKEDGMVSRDITEQILQAYRNFDKALKEAGVTKKDVVKVTQYVTDRIYLPEAMRLKDEYFSEPFPAITCLIKKFGHPKQIFKMHGVAYIGEEQS